MAKYGLSVAQVEALDARMEQTAAAEGLEYHLREDGVTGNTFDAHRLLQLAGARGRQDAAVERFYRAYFTEGRSIFEPEALTALAVDAGLTRPKCARCWRGRPTPMPSPRTCARRARWA